MPICRTQLHYSPKSGVCGGTPAATTKEYPDVPSEKEIEAVKQELVEEFAKVFDQSTGLRCMDGPDMVISLKEDAEPYYVNDARPIAFADGPMVKHPTGRAARNRHY